MLGTEIRHNEYKSLFSAAYGYDNRTLTSVPVVFPSDRVAESLPLHTETFTENAFVSWFATGSYTLLRRYTFGGSVRFDGSDILPRNTVTFHSIPSADYGVSVTNRS